MEKARVSGHKNCGSLRVKCFIASNIFLSRRAMHSRALHICMTKAQVQHRLEKYYIRGLTCFILQHSDLCCVLLS